MEIAPSVQVEWYVAGFPEAMGFQIRQTRPTNLREAMEAAHNGSITLIRKRRYIMHNRKRKKRRHLRSTKYNLRTDEERLLSF
jgi:hypothetical protein